jgi:hypothetical protein
MRIKRTISDPNTLPFAAKADQIDMLRSLMFAVYGFDSPMSDVDIRLDVDRRLDLDGTSRRTQGGVVFIQLRAAVNFHGELERWEVTGTITSVDTNTQQGTGLRKKDVFRGVLWVREDPELWFKIGE